MNTLPHPFKERKQRNIRCHAKETENIKKSGRETKEKNKRTKTKKNVKSKRKEKKTMCPGSQWQEVGSKKRKIPAQVLLVKCEETN